MGTYTNRFTGPLHGHKTAARSFDGYKGHIAEDPDSEIITATIVTPGNVGDAAVANDLIDDILPTDTDTHDGDGDGDGEVPVVYGDSAYGTGGMQQALTDAGVESRCRTQQPVNRNGRFSKAKFNIDLDADTVTCPNNVTVTIRRSTDATTGTAAFGDACGECPLREACTTSKAGRTISVGQFEAALAAARQRQTNSDWQADYRATRSKVERKLAHLMFRKHGGRRARVRGQTKVAADFALLAAARNVARLGALEMRSTPTGWATAT
ncbi:MULTISPECIES: transposase [Candidatus Neomicrothrix]|uniref:transposase n=1 Tax=Candidatus Neomicrothrix TaxID=41949 RepID=UPI002377F312|nr:MULTISPECIES: transposase [Microthrix]